MVCAPKLFEDSDQNCPELTISVLFDNLEAIIFMKMWKLTLTIIYYSVGIKEISISNQKLIKNLKGEIDILTFPIIDIFKFWRLLNMFSHIRVQCKTIWKYPKIKAL